MTINRPVQDVNGGYSAVNVRLFVCLICLPRRRRCCARWRRRRRPWGRHNAPTRRWEQRRVVVIVLGVVLGVALRFFALCYFSLPAIWPALVRGFPSWNPHPLTTTVVVAVYPFYPCPLSVSVKQAAATADRIVELETALSAATANGGNGHAAAAAAAAAGSGDKALAVRKYPISRFSNLPLLLCGAFLCQWPCFCSLQQLRPGRRLSPPAKENANANKHPSNPPSPPHQTPLRPRPCPLPRPLSSWPRPLASAPRTGRSRASFGKWWRRRARVGRVFRALFVPSRGDLSAPPMMGDRLRGRRPVGL